METGIGVLQYTENVVRKIAEKNSNISYKVNKINILIRHTESKNAILDIYGRIRNDEIRINISSNDSAEYKEYEKSIACLVDKSRIKHDVKGSLNFAFFVGRNDIEKVLTHLLNAR